MKHLALTLLLISLSFNSVQSQCVVQQGKLSTNATSTISVRGDLIIQGDVSHQGTLLLHDDLSIGSEFEASSGSLWLVGADQRIQADNISLAHLSVRGGGRKQLTGKLLVQNELQLADGILQADETAQLTLASGAQIKGGSATSYVDGFLYHSGTGEKFYPVGKDGTYAPATLLNVSGNNPTVGVAYFPSAKLNGTEFHWQQSVIDGTYEGSAMELTFTSDNTDYQEYSNELLVLATEDNSDQYTVLGQSSLNLQRNRFTIVSDQPTALPILTVGFDIPEDTKHLYLPNAFSPTAPNAEDRCIKVYGQKISSRNFYLAIQDVWGNIAYETTSWEEASTRGWVGTANASGVAVTYRYRLEGEFIGGKRFQQIGTIVQY